MSDTAKREQLRPREAVGFSFFFFPEDSSGEGILARATSQRTKVNATPFFFFSSSTR